MLGTEELRQVVTIGMELTNEKNKNKLLEKMLRFAMEISECDAGTLYIYKNEALMFKLMKTLSQGVDRGENGEVIDLPPVPLKEENICSYAAIHGELINIPDVYTSEKFDFSGPKKYDAMTGYRTGSMLVIPMIDGEGGLVGVMQLMNKQYVNGEFAAFNEDDEFALKSLASMAAISISEKNYMDEVKAQMHSFVNAFAKAVDARTPYNGSHTRKVTVYAGILAEHVNKKYRAGQFGEYFDDNRMDQLKLSATLHDIGKMIVPLSVMNKSTRLDDGLERVERRFDLLQVLYERDYYAKRISETEYKKMKSYLQDSIDFIHEVNDKGFLPEEDIEKVAEIATHEYKREDGSVLSFLSDKERDDLSIRKGTLTEEERGMMESHVVYTEKILEDVCFNKNYAHVVEFAATHHEKLNGKGYPKGLSEKDLALESKILAVVDVFDALTCTDRPYKKPMSREKAYEILGYMVKDGEIDGTLVEFLKEAMENITPEQIDKMVEESF